MNTRVNALKITGHHSMQLQTFKYISQGLNILSQNLSFSNLEYFTRPRMREIDRMSCFWHRSIDLY